MHRFFTAGAIAWLTFVAPASALAQRPATLLDIVPREQLQCGRIGWTLPGLIKGTLPVTACMLRVRTAVRSPFGPL